MWLPELGLYHCRARVYAPEIGRFLQTDPVGYEDQVNLYAYVHNDPLNFLDPTGKSSVVTGGTSAPALKAVQDSCGGANNACVRQVSSDMLKAGAVAATLSVPDVSDIVIAGAAIRVGAASKSGKAYSEYKDITKPKSKIENRSTNVNRNDFENNLEDSGFVKSTSKDGASTNYENGNKKCSIREKANSHDGVTADAYVDGQQTKKIRLEVDE